MAQDTITVAFFSLFFLFTGACVAFARWKWVRVTYGCAFFLLLLLFGLTQSTQWPFFSWSLFAHRAQPELSFYEIRIADGSGTEIKYDARAVRPSLITPLRRFAVRFPDYDRGDANEFASFLVGRARRYRDRLEGRPFEFWSWLKFPPHQMGFKWDRQSLKALGEFEEIRIYERHVTFSQSGDRVLGREERMVAAFSDVR